MKALGAVARLAALVACGLCSCVSPSDPPNVLLIVVDTLRADRLGCYGADRSTSPFLDSLAVESVRFERAYAPAPWTNPSVASILTGLYPSGHGVNRPGRSLSEEVTTLAEILRARGYATAGVISNSHLLRKYGFGQGFDAYQEGEARGHMYVSGEGVTREAVELLKTLSHGDRPFFLFVLFFDPHYAYMRHPEIGFARESAGAIRGGEPIQELRQLGPSMTREQVELIRDLYDEEVRFTDSGIERVVGALAEEGVGENTIIVVTSDHGEEFFERGWLGHTRTLYDELTRVPLVVHDPRRASSRVVPTPVSVVSLAPTILDLAGIDPTEYRFQAASLRPLLSRTHEGPWEPILCEVDFVPLFAVNRKKATHKRSIVAGVHKLIRDDSTGVTELYDLARDTSESRNLVGEQPELAARLSSILDRHFGVIRERAHETGSVEVTEEEIETMRGLGYVD